MKITQLIPVLALTSLAACAAHKDNRPAVALRPDVSTSSSSSIGTFRAELFPTLSTEDNFLTIGEKSITVVKVCKHAGEEVRAELTVPAIVSEGAFNVPVGAEQSFPSSHGPCTVKIDAGVTAFEVKHDELILTPTNASSYVYGHREGTTAADRLESAKRATAEAAHEVKEGAKQAAHGLKETAVNSTVVVKEGTAKAAAATRDAAAHAGAVVKDGVVATKDAAVDGATAVKDLTVNGAVAAKDATVHGAAVARDATVDTVVAAKDAAAEGAARAEEATKRTFAGARDFVVGGTRRFKDNTVREATTIRDGAVNVVVGTGNLIANGWNRVRRAVGAGLDKTGNGLKKAGEEVKPEEQRK